MHDSRGILIHPDSGVPYFTLERVKHHLERAKGNWNVAIHDALRAAERAEEEARESTVRGEA